MGGFTVLTYAPSFLPESFDYPEAPLFKHLFAEVPMEWGSPGAWRQTTYYPYPETGLLKTRLSPMSPAKLWLSKISLGG